jgi:hypothetical protein
MLFAAAVIAVTSLHIGRITINAVPLFSADEASHGSFYRTANILHVQTRTALLRSFLLFHEGDAYKPAKLAETERNLRQLDFLKSVSVTASEPHDGVVDVAVVTQDAWTTDVNGDFSNDGGKAAYDFDVTQKDLLGTGSELELHIDHGVKRNSNTLEFLHPAAIGPYWNLDTLYSKNSDGDEQKLELDRPLFSYETSWTAGFLFDHLLRVERNYSEGVVAARFRQEHREFALERSHVLHADEAGSSRITGGVDFLDDEFRHVPRRPNDIIPDSRHFRFLQAGYDRTGFRYIKLNYVDRDLREQDFNLGHIMSIRLGISPRDASSRHAAAMFRASDSAGYAFSDNAFVVGRINFSTRAPHDRNTILSAEARFVKRFDTRYPQAFVSRVRVDRGWQLDRDFQFLADGQNGLRAYPDFAFEGRERILLNVEQRVFLGREILQIFGPSLAAFVDSGQAFDRGVAFSGMKTDVGIGLRIGMARFESALIRIDFAYALNDSPISRKGHVWSISTVHAF